MAPVHAHQPPAPQQVYPSPATGGHPLPPEVTQAPYEAQAQAQAHAQAPVQGHTPSHAPAHAGAPAPAGPDAGPAYSSPTTSGDTRITDAQRARAEGRSPIIDPGMRPAAITAGLGVLLAGGAVLGSYGLLVPLVLLQALTAAGWFRLNGMWPARQGIALAFLGGVVADAALLAAGREHAAGAITGTLGVWVLLTVVLQLRSHADPDERMYGLMATVASAALAVLATGYLGAESDAVVAGALAVAAGTLARAVPLPGPVSAVVALLAAAAGGLAGGAFTGLGASSGALLGLGAGVCALIGLRAAAYDYPSRFVHMTAGVALPLTAAVPAVYLLGRVLA
ncbi:integral membrane protein [Streptomyces laurentii]|uniref:Integral membrane protein n=1 Tax=Streptomyces laurentii TaxID=39478 RepID=A0A160P2G1_STRLU|nr:integral membrane protein [Streptomyces laurentii]